MALVVTVLDRPGLGAQPASLVVLNGRATPVYFNDGDTFRALEGPLSGTAARLGGFNTLESYGPVHQWSTWTFKELYVNAKQATSNARRGVWHCDADPSERDGYGRMLAVCLDLAADQIAKGYAHVYSFEGPGHPRLLAAQRFAIARRHGMWSKGAPPLVLTSLHSADEGMGKGENYNRLISTLDGQSTKWLHDAVYRECEEVCHRVTLSTADSRRTAIATLRASAAGRHVAGWTDDYLALWIDEWLTTDRLAELLPQDAQEVVARELTALKTSGELRADQSDGSCMRYVPFQRRYVRSKPGCLKW